MATAVKKKNSRIDLRVSASVKEVLVKAAESCDQSLADFILSRAVSEAQEIVERQNQIILEQKAWDGFVALLTTKPPKKASTRLKKAMKRYTGNLG